MTRIVLTRLVIIHRKIYLVNYGLVGFNFIVIENEIGMSQLSTVNMKLTNA